MHVFVHFLVKIAKNGKMCKNVHFMNDSNRSKCENVGNIGIRENVKCPF